MTSFRQIEANRRNALKSTGPKTEEGKAQSRRNAVRHGLTAETVIAELEDADDYEAFEAAIIADYDATSAVERELVLRLASLLWRLRRATAMETGLFDLQMQHVWEARRTETNASQSSYAKLTRVQWLGADGQPVRDAASQSEAEPSVCASHDQKVGLATSFLGLANLASYPLDRLSRYEAILWRQVAQTLFALNALRRKKPYHRTHYSQFLPR